MYWMLIYFGSLIIFSGVVLLGRILYFVLTKDGNYPKRRSRAAKTLIILGSGGHTTEMLQIIRNLSFQQYSPRIYIHAQTDKMSAGKINDVELENGEYRVIKISRSREVGQSYLTSVWSTLVSFKDSMKIVWTEMPDLILCNGPGTCVPICIAAFVLKLGFIKETKIIFIESFCRVKTYSLTGKILYYIADSIIVQWPQLCKTRDKLNVRCVAAFVLKLGFIRETKIIFIESFCRVKTYSLTGKILYYIADSIIVQWPQLCKTRDKLNVRCVAAFVLKLGFIRETKIIFIESFCRVKTYSLTGKILYHIADSIIAPWLQLCKTRDKHTEMCDIASLTAPRIPWDVLVENLRDNVPVEMRIQLVPLCNELRSCCESNEFPPDRRIEDSLLRLEACLDQTWEALNTGYWKDVPLKHRYCYTLCSTLKCIFLEIQCAAREGISDTDKREKITEIIKQIDRAILLGAPLVNAPDLMTTMASRLNEFLSSQPSQSSKCNEIPIDDSEICKDLLPGLVWIQRLECPSMETFYRDLFKPKTPAVLEGCLSHWKALSSWKNIDYLMKVAGNRTVPIEIGSRYTEEDWSQSLVTFADFLRSHFSKTCEKVGYLAQHQLFEQIPELKEDFGIPDYCNFSDGDGDATRPDINAWFGPRGTLSPLHFDPKNNLLCQVFGCKRVILYRPEESPNLYCYETRMLSNTAQVDPVNPDFDKWPNFEKSKGSMCYLGPGDMLYIPPGWWHHVESLAPSFSISFWWC